MEDLASKCAIYCKRKDFQIFITGLLGSFIAGTAIWAITKKMETKLEEGESLTRLNRRYI